MMRETKLINFIKVQKNPKCAEKLLEEIKTKIDEWQTIDGYSYFRVLEVKEDKNILNSIIVVEGWGEKQFTPAHSTAYSRLALSNMYLKNSLNKE